MIASVHVIDASPLRTVTRTSPKPSQVDGLRWSNKALCGAFSPAVRPDVQPRRSGLVAWWDDDDALEGFLADHPNAAPFRGVGAAGRRHHRAGVNRGGRTRGPGGAPRRVERAGVGGTRPVGALASTALDVILVGGTGSEPALALAGALSSPPAWPRRSSGGVRGPAATRRCGRRMLWWASPWSRPP